MLVTALAEEVETYLGRVPSSCAVAGACCLQTRVTAVYPDTHGTENTGIGRSEAGRPPPFPTARLPDGGGLAAGAGRVHRGLRAGRNRSEASATPSRPDSKAFAL